MSAIIAVFNENDSCDAVVDHLSAQGIERNTVDIVLREKTVRSIEEIEVVTYVDHFEGPGPEARKGLLGGLIGGSAAGAAAVIAAMAGVEIFEQAMAVLFGSMNNLAVLAIALTGGAFAGALIGIVMGVLLGAADHDATKVKTVETQVTDKVETDGFVLTVDIDPASGEDVAILLTEVGADEVAVVSQEGRHLRTRLD